MDDLPSSSFQDAAYLKAHAGEQFRIALNRQRFVLAQLYHNALSADELEMAAEPKLASMKQSLPAFIPDEAPADFWEDERFAVAELETFVIFQDDVKEISAGTLVLILDRMIRKMRRQFELPPDLHAGQTCGHVKLTEAFQVAANNFRHYEDWQDETIADARRDKNLKTLRAAGVAYPTIGTACFEVLKATKCRTYLDLEGQLYTVASDFEKIAFPKLQ